MGLRSTVAAVLLLIALGPRVAADGWIMHFEELYPPTGVGLSDDRLYIFTERAIFDVSLDGSGPRSRSFSVAGGKLQIEHVTAGPQGFVAAGVYIEESPSRTARPAVLRLDAKGDVQWGRAIDGNWLTGMTHAAEAPDGDVIVATRLDDALMLLRFSATGELKWARSLDRTDVEDIKGLIATRDGGALVLTLALSRAAALTRVGPDGNVIWDRVMGNAEGGFGLYDAIEQPDGGFIAVGRLRTYSTNDRDAYVIRVSAKGDVIWQKMIGGDGEDGLYSLARVGADEFVAVGGTKSTGAGDPDTWLVRFTADGTITREIAAGIRGEEDGPVDPRRAYVTAIGGDALFASPAGLRLLAGRLADASSACSATRAVSTRVTDAKTSHRDALLESSAVTPAIHVIAASSDRDTVGLKTVCKWSGTATPPAKPEKAAADVPTEEEVFAEKTAKLLIDRKFRELDSLAAELRSSRATFESGASKLRAFYEAAGRHSTLAALGDEGHSRLLAEWETSTESATSRIARASHEYAIAQRVRGSGFYDSLLPEDAERHQALIRNVLASLRKVEQSGHCDAPCFELQVRAGELGGWSEPLQKLLEIDPRYWEVFDRAAFYLGVNWGGAPGDVARFVDRAAGRTKESLGEAVYALHHAPWRFGVMNLEARRLQPSPDWSRMRKGFRDFLRLHPRSRRAAHQFAAAAYRVARDRDTARQLFQSPLLEWKPGLAIWSDRAEYERAKSWALAEPVAPFAALIAAGRLPSERLVVPATVHFADGRTEQVRAFVAATGAGAVGVTVRGKTWVADDRVVTHWTIDAGGAVPVPATLGRWFRSWATFVPPQRVLSHLQPLKARTASVEQGDRLFIIGDEVIPVRALGSSGGGGISPVADRPIAAEKLAGAPVLDDVGAVAGVLVPPTAPGEPPMIVNLDLVLSNQ